MLKPETIEYLKEWADNGEYDAWSAGRSDMAQEILEREDIDYE